MDIIGEKKERVRYNRALLDYCLERDGATLVGEYEDITIKIKIKFICKCGIEGKKGFQQVYRNSGLLCHNCSIKIGNEKKKQTSLKNYGVESPLQNTEIYNKVKQTNLKKYGVEKTLQNPEIYNKVKQTNLKKYGVENPLKNKEIMEKVKKTNLKKYGFKNPSQVNHIKEKIKQNSLKKYGTEFHLQNKEVQEKIKVTNLKKYGVENPTQNIEIFEKSQTNMKKFKNYTMPSGDVRRVQGYEPFALDYLLKTYSEDQIITDRRKIPRISYKTSEEEKQRYYFPDIYIPHENKIIEVKSTWTIKLNPEIIDYKKKATQNAGYNYEIWCFNEKGERVMIE